MAKECGKTQRDGSGGKSERRGGVVVNPLRSKASGKPFEKQG